MSSNELLTKRPTRNDVARYANVSGWTVSNVLNGRSDVTIREDTRQRIREAAEHLGYRPNSNARALATGRTCTIGFWMCFDYSRYRAHVLHRMNQQMKSTEFELVVRDIEEEITKDIQSAKNVQIPVDGIIAFDTPTAGSVFRSSLSVPFVTMGAFCTEDKDYVKSDLYSGTVDALQHLIATGRKEIVYLVPTINKDDLRSQAYEHILQEAGLKCHYLTTQDLSLSSARRTVQAFIQSKPRVDAIFCHNDDLAFGAHRALCDSGVRIGEDISLVGFDGIEETEYLSPSLTTVVQPFEQMCEIAWQFLQNRINDPSIPVQQITLKPQLVIRGSS